MSKPWVLITGALGGIGQALVKKFSETDYNVLAADISPLKIKLPNNTFFIEFDLNEIAISSCYTEEQYNRINLITGGMGVKCIINNAAVQILEPVDEVCRKSWDRSFNINLKAPFFLVQRFLPDLIKNQGAVVNISSIHATQTKKDFSAYATSKAGLSALTRNMVLDIGDKVRINAIEPAAIATEMLKEGFAGEEDKYKKLEEYHPIKRVGTPKEVANLAHFLASDESRFVQGACISASGGIKNSLSDPS